MITDKLLPLALAFIMFSLGLGLTLADFSRVFRRPRAIVIGLSSQMLLLPAIGWLVCISFALPAEMAVGLMLLAACPGGASAGLVTRLAGGATALSIALTAITSALAVLSVPLVVDFSLRHFTGAGVAVALPLLDVVRGVFVVTTVPVALGMWLRHLRPRLVARLEPVAGHAATGLFVVIVIATFVSQRQVLFDHLADTGAAALLLCMLTMATGFGLAALAHVDRPNCIAITVESGLQNAALAIFLAVSVLKAPALAVPGVVYALLMNVCAFAFIGWMRRNAPINPAQEAAA